MKIEEIRVSEIGMARSCEYRFYLSRITKEQSQGARQFVGSVFHRTMEQYFQNKAITGKDMVWTEFKDIYEYSFNELKDGVDFSALSEMKAFYLGLEYLNNYYQKRCRVLYPGKKNGDWLVEKRFFINAKKDGVTLRITGKIDLITNSMIVIDYKTSGSMGLWNQERADREYQGQIYPLLCRANRIDVKGFQFNIVSDKELNVYDVEYKPEKVQEILKYAFELAKVFEEENFDNLKVSNSKRICDMCNFKNECSKKRG